MEYSCFTASTKTIADHYLKPSTGVTRANTEVTNDLAFTSNLLTIRREFLTSHGIRHSNSIAIHFNHFQMSYSLTKSNTFSASEIRW